MNSLADAAAAIEGRDSVEQIVIDHALGEGIRMANTIGIQVNLADLPSHTAQRQARSAVFGEGAISGFWRFTILRNLLPNRHQKLVDEWRDVYKAYMQEFFETVLREGRIVFDERQAET